MWKINRGQETPDERISVAEFKARATKAMAVIPECFDLVDNRDYVDVVNITAALIGRLCASLYFYTVVEADARTPKHRKLVADKLDKLLQVMMKEAKETVTNDEEFKQILKLLAKKEEDDG